MTARANPPDSPAPRRPLRVLMVCMGNICRSPTAEAVFCDRLLRAGLASQVEVDSAGTHGYHVGEPPDERSQAHAARRGYDLSALRARRVQAVDADRFDLLLAMDEHNLRILQAMCKTTAQQAKVAQLTDFVPAHSPWSTRGHVPDPYYGGAEGFEEVLDIVEAACDGLLGHVRHLLHQGG